MMEAISIILFSIFNHFQPFLHQRFQYTILFSYAQFPLTWLVLVLSPYHYNVTTKLVLVSLTTYQCQLFCSCYLVRLYWEETLSTMIIVMFDVLTILFRIPFVCTCRYGCMVKLFLFATTWLQASMPLCCYASGSCLIQ